MPTLRRILIDCSLIDFSRQPTGIPRVVLKYLEIGYGWGELNSVEVVPVVPANGCMFICRPVPGLGAPISVLTAAATQANLDAPVSLDMSVSHAELARISADLRNTLSGMLVILGRLGSGALSPVLSETESIRAESGNSDPDPLTRNVRIVPGPQDLIFCPAYWHDIPPERYRNYAASGAKIIILVHDILPITFPRFYKSPWCYDFKQNVVAAFDYAAALCAVSNYTRHGLMELAARQRLKSIPIMTTYNGFEPMPLMGTELDGQSSRISGIQELGRYYVMVGSIEPKKGHRPVIACFEEMWAAGLQSNLLIIGRKGWLEQDAVAAIETSPYYRTKLFWFSGIDDFELGQVYARARALVFSSLGEGFGIPMIEAAAYGRPVIAYDTPIVQEILGGRALKFVTGAEFVARIVEMEQDRLHFAASVEMSQVAWPSWQNYTPRVFDALRDFFEDLAPLPSVVPRLLASTGPLP